MYVEQTHDASHAGEGFTFPTCALLKRGPVLMNLLFAAMYDDVEDEDEVDEGEDEFDEMPELGLTRVVTTIPAKEPR